MSKKHSPSHKTRPCVYLVGAGPGDPELITVRGRQLLSRADIIVYDHLSSPKLLRFAHPDAELIYVGKEPENHSFSQAQINQLLIAKAHEVQTIVRLKGGDPFVFGRGGEEAIALARADIDFEIVPGVTAGIAAPAYAGIPVTHREFAGDVAFITGQEDETRADGSSINWSALAAWRGTLVFYMGVKNLPTICKNLLDNGMDPQTPAVIITRGTTPKQRSLTATIDLLPRLARENKFPPPAIIVVGHVVNLRSTLNWYENRPLFGKRIVVTRARNQSGDLVDQLTYLGGEVLEFPTIRIQATDDPDPLNEAIEYLDDYDWIVFTSVNGVDAFFDAMARYRLDARRLYQLKVCAIGPETAQRLRQNGIITDLLPRQFTAQSIGDAFIAREKLRNKKILLPRSDLAQDDLPNLLSAMGAEVDEITAYRTVIEESFQDELIEAIEQDSIDWLTLTSPSTVHNFLKMIDADTLGGKKLRIASIGPTTSDVIKRLGLKVDVQAHEYTIPSLIDAIIKA